MKWIKVMKTTKKEATKSEWNSVVRRLRCTLWAAYGVFLDTLESTVQVFFFCYYRRLASSVFACGVILILQKYCKYFLSSVTIDMLRRTARTFGNSAPFGIMLSESSWHDAKHFEALLERIISSHLSFLSLILQFCIKLEAQNVQHIFTHDRGKLSR